MVMLSKKPKDPLTIYSYSVNGTFAEGVSIIGGPITINGVVLLAMISDLAGDDDNGSMRVKINGVRASTGEPYEAFQATGLFSAWSGTVGFLYYIDVSEIDLPHVSFDVVSSQGGSNLFHRTVKVVVLNA